MTNIRRALEAAAAVGGDATYVEDVYQTFVRLGDGSTPSIDVGMDMTDGEFLVWIKDRDDGYNHILTDTVRGATKVVKTDVADSEQTYVNMVTSFDSVGYNLGTDVRTNTSGDNYVDWIFKSQRGFFDIVTYTGTGSAHAISHSLGSTPGCIMIKNLSESGAWNVYHRSNTASPETDYLVLNTTAATVDDATVWNDTLPTSTQFTVGTADDVNTNTENYVAYLFAHDDQSFGADSDESIIKCGGFTTTATWGNYKVDLGWEPQYLLIKRVNATDYWWILDSTRGIVGPGVGTVADTSVFYNLYQLSDDAELRADTAQIEGNQGRASLYSQGFMGTTGFGSAEYVYIAIRRGPMKVPEAGTEVFAPALGNGPDPAYVSGFPVDMGLDRIFNITADWDMSSRLTGATRLEPNLAAAEGSQPDCTYDFMNGYRTNGNGINSIAYMFRRTPEVFDIICWVGLGQSAGPRTVNHNLGVKPELFITKNRDSASSWYTTYGTFDDQHLMLNLTNAISTYDLWGGDATTTTVTVENDTVNELNKSFIGYLFATLDGVSKVGTYTADATLTTIDCGFAAGARFILIKRLNDYGDWYLYNSLRGIVAGNDPYLVVNTDAAEVTGTDYIDPDNSGFQLTAAGSSTINVNTGQYLFLAIA